MQREHLYLQDIIEACDMIQTFLEGMDVSTFLASELHKAAILQKLTVIGEAAAGGVLSLGGDGQRTTARGASRHPAGGADQAFCRC